MPTNVWTFARRELKTYFNSPIAYIIIILALIISGWLFFLDFFLAGQATLRSLLTGWMPLIFLIFVPAITMRLIAEEKKSGTVELLVTLPVTDWEIVLGKYLAALVLLAVTILMTFSYVIMVSMLGDPDGGAIFGQYLGLFLLGATYLAIGLFASGITANQIVAFLVAIVITAAFFLLDKFTPFFPGPLASVLEFLGVNYHFNNLARGVIDTRDLLYYLSMIFLFLFLAVRALESRKWK
jgi:ABC-2 type transport system permease protein